MLAIRSALISAAHKDLGIEKTLVRKALFFPSDAYPGGLRPLDADDPDIREDFVRVGARQADLRRLEFKHWRVNVVIKVDSDLMNEQDVINLVNRAGFSVGIGEWRPERGGEFGRFEFDTTEPIRELSRDDLRKSA